MSIKVKAIRKGHYTYLREVGEKFVVKNKEDLSSFWMERLDRKPIGKVKPKSRPKKVVEEFEDEELETEELETEELETEELETEELETEELEDDDEDVEDVNEVEEVEEQPKPKTRRRRRS